MRVFTIFFFLVFTCSCFGQTFDMGIRTIVTFPSFQVSSYNGRLFVAPNTASGGKIGIMSEIAFERTSFQIDLLLGRISGNFYFFFPGNTRSIGFNHSFITLDIPMTFGLDIGKMWFRTGPILSVLVGEKRRYFNTISYLGELPLSGRNLRAGFQVGFGAEARNGEGYIDLFLRINLSTLTESVRDSDLPALSSFEFTIATGVLSRHFSEQREYRKLIKTK